MLILTAHSAYAVPAADINIFQEVAMNINTEQVP